MLRCAGAYVKNIKANKLNHPNHIAQSRHNVLKARKSIQYHLSPNLKSSAVKEGSTVDMCDENAQTRKLFKFDKQIKPSNDRCA